MGYAEARKAVANLKKAFEDSKVVRGLEGLEEVLRLSERGSNILDDLEREEGVWAKKIEKKKEEMASYSGKKSKLEADYQLYGEGLEAEFKKKKEAEEQGFEMYKEWSSKEIAGMKEDFKKAKAELGVAIQGRKQAESQKKSLEEDIERIRIKITT